MYELTKEQLIDEIKVLQKAASLHTKYSIEQYKKVLSSLEELENERKYLEEKVIERTTHLETEINKKEIIANELEKIAKFDTLTGLPNRYMFKEELDLIIKESKLMSRSFALLFLDLDGFKDINDTYGHESGDRLLKIVSDRLKNCVRQDSDVVSRLGGDEFTIILKSIRSKKKLAEISQKIISEVSKEILIDSKTKVSISVSIGIYEYQNDTDLDTVISKADIAMYEAKYRGKNTYVFFSEDMHERVKEKFTLNVALKKAYENKEFITYLQPIVDSVSHKIIGAEALIRWEKDGELVPPYKFIGILEETRLIEKVTLWQIENVLKKYVKTKQKFAISFNLSLSVINSDEIIYFLKKIKTKYKINPKKIYFEITETSLAQNSNLALEIISEIKNLGFQISLDDFGTGYSSLSYIRTFPIDTLKIDKAFIDGILTSKKDNQLLNAILHMAQTLDMNVVIEGIETKEQLDLLKSNKKTKFQGYYFYKPMPINEFIKLV